MDAFHRESHGHEVNCAGAEDAFLFVERHIEFFEAIQACDESLVVLMHGSTVNSDIIVNPLDTREAREYHVHRPLKNFDALVKPTTTVVHRRIPLGVENVAYLRE